MSQQEIILVDAAVEVDDETVTVEGNTLVIVEGQGESTVKGATNGGTTVAVVSQDVTTKVGKIKFEMPASIKSNNIARDFKALGPGRVVRVSGIDDAGNRYGRTLTQGTMVNDPEKAIQNEGKIPVEFHGAPLTVS